LENMCFLRYDTFFTKKRKAQRLGDYWCFIENTRYKCYKKGHNGKQEKTGKYQKIIKKMTF